MFANPSFVAADNLDKILRGSALTPTKKRSIEMESDLRNLLRTRPTASFSDLYSRNIQRNRDHELPTYGQIRDEFGLDSIDDNFVGFLGNDKDAELEDIYESPDNMDLWVGIIAEPRVNNSILGDVGTKIVRDNFLRIRDGDRFWFER